MNKTYGAVVGRFQAPILTVAHTELMCEAQSKHDQLIVFVGVIDSPPTVRNPLSFELRKQMILKEFPLALVVSIKDVPNDEIWSSNLDALVANLTEGNGVTFYVGRDSFKDVYSGVNPVVECDFGIICSATAIRDDLRSVPPTSNRSFRAGVIHAMQSLWNRSYSTVDMALVKPVWGGHMIVLVRKPGETQWQLPGGFVDLGETYSEAAEREMQEECHLGSSVGWTFIQDLIIDDWRTRNVPMVQTKTHLMLGIAASNTPNPVADDDIEEARWFWQDTVATKIDTLIKKNHRDLVRCALEGIDNHFFRKNNV